MTFPDGLAVWTSAPLSTAPAEFVTLPETEEARLMSRVTLVASVGVVKEFE